MNNLGSMSNVGGATKAPVGIGGGFGSANFANYANSLEKFSQKPITAQDPISEGPYNSSLLPKLNPSDFAQAMANHASAGAATIATQPMTDIFNGLFNGGVGPSMDIRPSLPNDPTKEAEKQTQHEARTSEVNLVKPQEIYNGEEVQRQREIKSLQHEIAKLVVRIGNAAPSGTANTVLGETGRKTGRGQVIHSEGLLRRLQGIYKQKVDNDAMRIQRERAVKMARARRGNPMESVSKNESGSIEKFNNPDNAVMAQYTG